MKKNSVLNLLITTGLALFIASFASASTSSSLPSKVSKQPANKFTHQCLLMFKEAEKLIRDAEKQPGTHPKVKNMKNKLLESKQKIAKMDSTLQEKSCNKGLIALNNLRQKY